MDPQVEKAVTAARVKIQEGIDDMSNANPQAPIGVQTSWVLIVHEVVYVDEEAYEGDTRERSMYWMDTMHGSQAPHVSYGLLYAGLQRTNMANPND
jgi:hypothetical protein